MSTEMSSCYFCRNTFRGSSIERSIDRATPLCPTCGVDSVVRGVVAPSELESMHLARFGATHILLDALRARGVKVHGIGRGLVDASAVDLRAETVALIVGENMEQLLVNPPGDVGVWEARIVLVGDVPVPARAATARVEAKSAGDLAERIAGHVLRGVRCDSRQTRGGDVSEPTETKRGRMLALVERRRNVAPERQLVWDRYKRIGDWHDGAYECDHVSPLSIAAGNLDADIVVMAQDWSSSTDMEAPPREGHCGYNPELPTNVHLDKLLAVHFGLTRSEVFATNLFPFIKIGGMSASIPARDLTRAAREYALPQVDIIGPRIVVCLGLVTFNALRRAVDLKPVPNLSAGVAAGFDRNGARYWCQAHTGALGRNNRNRGGVDRVDDDWARMATWMQGRP